MLQQLMHEYFDEVSTSHDPWIEIRSNLWERVEACLRAASKIENRDRIVEEDTFSQVTSNDDLIENADR